MLSGYTEQLDSKETIIGSRNQEASLSAGKNIEVVLVPCLCMKVHQPTDISGDVNISEVPQCHLL